MKRKILSLFLCTTILFTSVNAIETEELKTFFKKNNNKFHSTLLIVAAGIGALTFAELLFSAKKREFILNLATSFASLWKKDSRDYVKEALASGNFRLVAQVGILLGILAEESIYWGAKGISHWIDKKTEKAAKAAQAEKEKSEAVTKSLSEEIRKLKEKNANDEKLVKDLSVKIDKLAKNIAKVPGVNLDVEALKEEILNKLKQEVNKSVQAMKDNAVKVAGLASERQIFRSNKIIDEGIKALEKELKEKISDSYAESKKAIEDIQKQLGVNVDVEALKKGIIEEAGTNALKERLDLEKRILEKLKQNAICLSESYAKGEEAITSIEGAIKSIKRDIKDNSNIGIGAVIELRNKADKSKDKNKTMKIDYKDLANHLHCLGELGKATNEKLVAAVEEQRRKEEAANEKLIEIAKENEERKKRREKK